MTPMAEMVTKFVFHAWCDKAAIAIAATFGPSYVATHDDRVWYAAALLGACAVSIWTFVRILFHFQAKIARILAEMILCVAFAFVCFIVFV